MRIPQFVIDEVDTPNYHTLDYRVILKIIWYNGDGTKQEVLTSSPSIYRSFKDGQYMFDFGSCYYAFIA